MTVRCSSSAGMLTRHIGVERAARQQHHRRTGGWPVEPVGAHGAERCWHIGRLADRRKLRHGGLVDAQEMRAGSLTLEVSDVVARHYSTVTDFARLRGLSTS